MPYALASDGAKIYYEADGEGAPLLICNASFSTHLHWRAQVERLSRSFRFVTWDYRGHGRSDVPLEAERYSLAQVIDDLRVVHEAAAGDVPALVGGLSVGGLITLRYALDQPARVTALLLCNSGPGFKNPQALKQWNAMLERAAAKMAEVGLEAYLEGDRAGAELLGANPGSPWVRIAREGVLRSDVRGLTHFARQVAGPVPNLVDRLAEIAQPCLVLVGEHDTAFQRAAEVMAAKLPNARRLVLKGAGHPLNLDEPEAFCEAIERFHSEL